MLTISTSPSMADPSSFSSTPSAPLPHKVNLSPFYYGLIVVGSTALVLAIYNLIVVGICTHRRRQRLLQMSTQPAGHATPSFENSSSTHLFSTFKYSFKDNRDRVSDNECSVCLSNFEDGEDVRQMPQCKHAFHATCIDMWLYSHSDCPLCRAVVVAPGAHNRVLSEDSSREVFRDPSDSV